VELWGSRWIDREIEVMGEGGGVGVVQTGPKRGGEEVSAAAKGVRRVVLASSFRPKRALFTEANRRPFRGSGACSLVDPRREAARSIEAVRADLERKMLEEGGLVEEPRGAEGLERGDRLRNLREGGVSRARVMSRSHCDPEARGRIVSFCGV